MRSEHRTTGDEWDAFSKWRHVLAYLDRSGARRKIKRASHRIDRRAAKRRIREGDE